MKTVLIVVFYERKKHKQVLGSIIRINSNRLVGILQPMVKH